MGRLDRESKDEHMLEVMVKDGGIPVAKKVSVDRGGIYSGCF